MSWQTKREQIRKSSRRRTTRALLCGLLATGVISVGGAYAFFTDTQTVENHFSVAEPLDISVVEPHWDTTDDNSNGIPDIAENLVPTQTIAKDPQLVNESTTPCWMIAQVKVPVRKARIVGNNGEALPESDIELFSYDINDGWHAIGEPAIANDGTCMVHTYAALEPVASNGSTVPIFNDVRVANIVEGSVYGACSIDVVGYGIQTLGFDSPEAAWEAYKAQQV